MGYFDKIKKVDKFVILDDVQVPKTGGGPWNRAKINLNGNISNLTVPFYRKSGLHKFNEIFYVNNEWRNKIKKTIFHSYSKSKNYSKYINYIESIIDFDSNNMAIYNTNAILSLSKLLGISGDKFVLSSSLNISTAPCVRIVVR